MRSPPPLGLAKWALMEGVLLCWWASNGDGGSMTAPFSMTLWDNTDYSYSVQGRLLVMSFKKSQRGSFVGSSSWQSVGFSVLSHALLIFMTCRERSGKSRTVVVIRSHYSGKMCPSCLQPQDRVLMWGCTMMKPLSQTYKLAFFLWFHMSAPVLQQLALLTFQDNFHDYRKKVCLLQIPSPHEEC